MPGSAVPLQLPPVPAVGRALGRGGQWEDLVNVDCECPGHVSFGSLVLTTPSLLHPMPPKFQGAELSEVSGEQAP